MIIEHEELSKILPHKGKMFIIGRITNANPAEWTIESETEITPDFMFYDKNAGGAPNYACFEIVAQTIAALTGLIARESAATPKMGFILSVSNLHFDFDIIKSGEKVKVRTFRDSQVENVYSVKAEIYIDDKFSGEGKITAMVAENDK
ncbi:MAG: hypothetical protein II821_08015 [Treponema sp.]|nr:hypothetical protein [Treponema sp.]